jgi:hypothetical protein
MKPIRFKNVRIWFGETWFLPSQSTLPYRASALTR